MKIRLILVVLIILAQLGWLSVDYIRCIREQDDAPRILVKASVGYEGEGRIDGLSIELAPDSAILGKSIWWGSDWGKGRKGESRVVPPREKPGEEVQGALELRCKDWRDVEMVREDGQALPKAELSAIWSKGEDGLWSCRLEAPGSSEDVTADGEQRTAATLIYRIDDTDGTPHVSLVACPMSPVLYRLNHDLRSAYREWKNALPENRQSYEPKATMEVALRRSLGPIATQLFFEGIPVAEAIGMMQKGEFPLPAEDEKKDGEEKEGEESNSGDSSPEKEVASPPEG